MTVTLHFHGAAGTVTGSCYRVVHAKGQFLVDCGLFQGNKTVRDLNYKPFPFDPRAIDFLLLTHAHIDHAGLLPRLTHLAGLELGTGLALNVVAPEDAAAALRDA